LCGGELKVEELPCVKAYGMAACGAVGKKEISDDLYRLSMKSDIDGTYEYAKDGIHIYSRHLGGCPDGHGFYGLVEDRKEYPIDIFWRV
jgi:trehalose/maltose hydrolase-like predicted phosphorylase